ncbi:MAG: hypothetical protein UX98_C0012G0009 [Parcubacteria group bacterium GW2011_GWA2_47_26]|nr:MAG: hypothetical protein UX98_C0012G0009 [Parcubacteria group bacterium GW2011_GWA2_47_26]
MQEPGQVAGVAEDVARGRQAHRSLLARLVVEVRLDPAQHPPDTGPRELEALGGDVRVDVAEVALAHGALDKRDEAERLVVGDRVPHLRDVLGQELLEQRAVVGVRQRKKLLIREVMHQSFERACGCRCHDRASFRSFKSSTPSQLARRKAEISRPSCDSLAEK